MSDQLITSIVTVLTAIVGVAILAVLVSKNSQTGAVIGAGGNAFAQDLSTALSPITSSGGGSLNNLFSGFGGGGAGSYNYA